MDVLIIGGSGFVSGTLARAALERGDRVWAVTRGQRALPAGVSGLIADRKDPVGFAQAVMDAGTTWDMVVDCIAYSPAEIQQDLEVLAGRARQLVMISTDFVYDPARRTFPQEEEHAFYLSENYGGLKRQAELALQAGAPPDLAWTVLRPCHIYGPGSQLGCLPEHGRDPQLIRRLKEGEALRLVGGGYFLQQPVLAGDLVQTILSCGDNPRAAGQTYNVAGPEIVESREYYRLIAEYLGVPLQVQEVPVDAFMAARPETASFLCHRIYDLSRLRESGLAVPATPLADGLRAQVDHLLAAK